MKHANASNKLLTLDHFFRPDNFDVINAEVTFTDFLVEHNMQLSASDHAGACFRKMFPDSKIASHPLTKDSTKQNHQVVHYKGKTTLKPQKIVLEA